jgi:hypothetical protein
VVQTICKTNVRCIYARAGRFHVAQMETRTVDGFSAYFFKLEAVAEDAVRKNGTFFAQFSFVTHNQLP